MDAKGFAMSCTQSLILLCTMAPIFFIENGKQNDLSVGWLELKNHHENLLG